MTDQDPQDEKNRQPEKLSEIMVSTQHHLRSYYHPKSLLHGVNLFTCSLICLSDLSQSE